MAFTLNLDILNNSDLTLLFFTVTLIIFILIILFLILFVNNTNAQLKHQQEIIKIEQERKREASLAERETTKRVLQDIGRELHDNIGQILTFCKLTLDQFQNDSTEQSQSINTTIEHIDITILEITKLSRSLNESFWDQTGLFSAISKESMKLNRLGLIKSNLNWDGTECVLEEDQKIMLFRIFQEILNNSLKHSQAVNFSINLKANAFELGFRDDGKGFNPNKIKMGAGIYNIEKRAELCGFNAKLETLLDQGCYWQITKRK